MIYPFLKIRLKQILRSILAGGVFRLPIILILLGVLLIWIFSLCNDKENARYLTVAILVFVSFIQIKRSDKIFLKTNFSNYRLFYLVDYYLICLVPLFCLLWHFRFVEALFLLFGCSLIPFLAVNITRKTRNTKIQKWIPKTCFEWKAGVRKMFLPMLIFFMLGAGSSFLVGAVPVMMLFLTICILEFYNKNEPYEFILSYGIGGKYFLFQKIKTQILLFSTIILPLIVLFLIFHYQYWYVVIIEYIILMSLLIYKILLKYAFYIPNAQTSAAYTTVGMFFGLILPIFVPVVWGLSIYFYFKAQRRLNFYLNDYN